MNVIPTISMFKSATEISLVNIGYAILLKPSKMLSEEARRQ